MSQNYDIVKEDFRILWSQTPYVKIDWHLHVPFMEACRQNFSFMTWIQRTKDVDPWGCWSESKMNLFWKILGAMNNGTDLSVI